jgi:hypothetical protein
MYPLAVRAQSTITLILRLSSTTFLNIPAAHVEVMLRRLVRLMPGDIIHRTAARPRFHGWLLLLKAAAKRSINYGKHALAIGLFTQATWLKDD